MVENKDNEGWAANNDDIYENLEICQRKNMRV